MDRGWKSFEVHAGTSRDYCDWIVGRNMEMKGDSGESSERKKGELWRKRPSF